MAVYGKLKRKTTVRSNVSFSPKKHCFLGEKSEELARPPACPKFASFSNSSTSSFTHDEKDSSSQTYTSDNSDALISLNTGNTTVTSCSPILKSTGGLDAVFKDFEDLEEDTNDYRPRKIIKTLSTKTARRDNTIFASGEIGDEFSDIELTSSISSSLESLNTRISELESAVNSKTKTNERMRVESNLHKTNNTNNTEEHSNCLHYGNNRSHRQHEKALSEDESEPEIEDLLDIAHESSKKEKLKAQSLQELRTSVRWENSKIELDMIIDHVAQCIDMKGKEDELLLVKLDLLRRFNSDIHFHNYWLEHVAGKSKSPAHYTLEKLLRTNGQPHAVNLHFASLIGLNEPIDVIEQQVKSVIQQGEERMDQVLKDVKAPGNKLFKDMAKSYNAEYVDLTTFQVVLQVISKTSEGCLHFEIIAEAINRSLRSDNDETVICCLAYLRECLSPEIFFDNSGIMHRLSKLLLESDSTNYAKYNTLLECCLKILCAIPRERKDNDLMFGNAIWRKLCHIIQVNWGVTKQSPSDDQQKQCLYALGYCFNSAIRKQGNANWESIRPVIDAEIAADVSTMIQAHCYGYLACIMYHLGTSSNKLGKADINKLRKMLNIYKKFEGDSPNNVGSLSLEVEAINMKLRHAGHV